ncbi:hypothetical protein AVEN_36651-1 [Araneus ventricosus]|uniref:Uncharacterized protein n=1 Tax=Araneus ventricosus TaxID=182803 RepID=A0A4Y2FUV3_ARAVE|nr:hypothetical protein AVEN_36651-1 [Araneus ventricosus]
MECKILRNWRRLPPSKNWYCLTETGFRAATWHYREGRPPADCGRNSSCSWHHSENELLQIGYFKDSSEPDSLQRDSKPDASAVKLELIGRRSGDLLSVLMKAGSALAQAMAVCWLEGGQVSTCNQPVCGLDTLDLYLELWSGEQFPMTAGALSW